MTNSCVGGGIRCNCDKNDQEWRADSGYLTDKNTLPVTELRFGDTGDTRYPIQRIRISHIGKIAMLGLGSKNVFSEIIY
jgi:hypothetical protein